MPSVNTSPEYYSHNSLFQITPPQGSDLAFASDDGGTTILINESGVGHVIVRHAGQQETHPFALPNVPHLLRSMSGPGKSKWLIDQLPLHPRIASHHPYRVVFSVRSFSCTFTEGIFAFSPAVRTFEHARRVIIDYQELVFVAFEQGLIVNPLETAPCFRIIP